MSPEHMQKTDAGFYMLICRDCDGDLPIPFDSPDERGKWAAAHTRGTGHDNWFVFNQRTGGWVATGEYPAETPEAFRRD